MKEENTTIDPTWMEKTGGFARDMTLRDYYAGLVMRALVRYDDVIEVWRGIPADAYEMADAMLRARDAK
jgi:hypothetical protein